MRVVIALFTFVVLLSIADRKFFKESHGFSLHVIESPHLSINEPNPPLPFPQTVFSQPFHYLAKGAQSFVFESEDKTTVLKFYRFPSHLRRFPWAHHPLGYLFFPSRKTIQKHNIQRLELSFHSFQLAAQELSQETAVLYVHNTPTTTLHQKVHLIDRMGFHYHLPLDPLAFVVQKRGVPFLPRFKALLTSGHIAECKEMLNGLVDVIQKRCERKITDLDNMDNDNYGWLDGQAIHLDIGRFQECPSINPRAEIMRITHPLTTYLEVASPELHTYFLSRLPNPLP